MTELLTAARMRALEKAAIDSGAVTGLELMERAGQGVVDAVLAEWPALATTPQRAVVLCGPGNNGGDGFVIARLLHARGWQVEVFLCGDPERLPPDARANCERWRGMGRIAPLTLDAVSEGPAVGLCVDALFGTGLSRPVAPGIVAAVSALADAFLGAARVVAVDICSGLCADSGRILGARGASLPDALRPDLTVTFHRARPGHYLAEGPEICGRVEVRDIGLPASSWQKYSLPGPDTAAVRLTGSAGIADLAKRPGAHKYGHGHALILSGGPGRTGAARLAARGALRVGAGLVTLGVPPAAQLEVAGRITAIMLARVADAGALAARLADARLSALCLGPGLGPGRARDLVPAALGQGGARPRPTVLDADALTAFADAPGALFEMLHEGCVLTPHAGEFGRLFPDIAARLAEPPAKGPAYSKLDATREAAARAGCVVLFKGPDTVIAAADGRATINASVHDRAAPWLATAGSGDVLAGFVTGLLARGLPAMRAAETAAWLHTECALAFGPGLIAEDLPEALPGVFRRLGL